LSTATSRVRSRMDIAIVFAETSNMAKTTIIACHLWTGAT
jgi:hypothetical protein